MPYTKDKQTIFLVPYWASEHEANMALASHPRKHNDCNTNQQRLQSSISAVQTTIAKLDFCSTNNDCKSQFLQYQQRLQSTISAVQTRIANHNARNANDYANQSRMRYAHFGSQL
jgi:hypothetical protein